jgi:hypothetical protein
MGMRTDVKEQNNTTINRQLQFPSDIYGQADDFATSENKRLKHFSGKEKLYIKDIIPILITFGLKFVKMELYTPADRVREFTKDEKWVKLRAKAELAVEDFKKYQDKLLEE